MLSSNDIRKKFINFYKKRDHAVIPNVSLVPQNDPTLLFVNSGMFPLVPYLSGQKHPMGKRLVNIQRCLRTEDIEEVKDNRHHTMFEMLGNWSLNDYFKEEQLNWVFKLFVEEFNIDPNKLYVTIFTGDKKAPRDEESIKIWKNVFKKYGINAKFSENIYVFDPKTGKIKDPDLKIFPYNKENWWKRGEAPGELGGPSSEIFYDLGEAMFEINEPEHINSDSGRFIELGNNVFMQYKMDKSYKWQPLKQKNIDFGAGLERIVSVIQKVKDNYETDLFMPIIQKLEDISSRSFKNDKSKENFRIIADHLRASTFILADEIIPSNKDQGYILRRLIRRAIRYGKKLGIEQNFTNIIANTVIDSYKEYYPHLQQNIETILNEIEREEIKFNKTLEKGLHELEKIKGKGIQIDGKLGFKIYETYGFPLEMILEEIAISKPKEKQKFIQEFKMQEKKHQEKSRQGSLKRFKGGLADHSEETTRLHTAHHLLLAALQKILGPHIHQRGSNITNLRLRIDFSHNEKLTSEQIKEVENLVNKIINEGWIVEKKIMPKKEAEEIGAEMEFGTKYSDLVSVYFIKNNKTGEIFSKEFCGGPHVKNTKELLKSGKFKIIKEQSSGSGIRRIKAVLQ